MNSLIDFDGLGEVIINLTNKLADGIGWIANRETTKKLAIDTYIRDIQESDYDELTKAAMISKARKTIKEYCNQNDIYQIAIKSIDSKAKPQDIEEDWLDQFMSKAGLVSDKVLQQIWGRLLAQECNEANSIPKVVLHILEQMDKQDALAFSALCSLSVYVEEDEKDYSPVVIASKLEEFYSELGITYNALVDLQALGLIEMNIGVLEHTYRAKYDTLPITICYYDKAYVLPREMDSFRVGNVIFTKAGQALCSVIEVEKQEGFWEQYCLPIWEEEVGEFNKKRNAAEKK